MCLLVTESGFTDVIVVGFIAAVVFVIIIVVVVLVVDVFADYKSHMCISLEPKTQLSSKL